MGYKNEIPGSNGLQLKTNFCQGMFTAQSRQLKIEQEDFSMSETGYDTKKTLIFAVYLSVF